MPATDRGKSGVGGERRFADSVKTMVSGEAGFVIGMSFPASLIGRNDYVAYAPQRPRCARIIFRFQKTKFALPRRNHRQYPANAQQKINVANT
ncbi:hypothetical protein [Janthinobacterium sp. JC611]|uniref:hypothetical protein n=1 Tax=Janthinobacterium sp. JC611 TaxID=2816201 RepID=UPI001BFDCE9C|nr:hypothetical protein [Janthinobacterium sp. JC611]